MKSCATSVRSDEGDVQLQATEFKLSQAETELARYGAQLCGVPVHAHRDKKAAAAARAHREEQRAEAMENCEPASNQARSAASVHLDAPTVLPQSFGTPGREHMSFSWPGKRTVSKMQPRVTPPHIPGRAHSPELWRRTVCVDGWAGVLAGEKRGGLNQGVSEGGGE